MHILYDQLDSILDVQMIHIADAVAKPIVDHGLSNVGLLLVQTSVKNSKKTEHN